MKNKKGLGFIITGLLAISAALFLGIFNAYEARSSSANANYVLAQLDNLELDEASAAIIDGSYSSDTKAEMTTKVVDGYEYVGEIEIQSLNLRLPVMGELTYDGLKIAPSLYNGSPYKGNFVIAAHNYSSHFGRIKELSNGDEVTFTDIEGNIFTYKVALTEIIEPTAVGEMISDEWALTLFTCTVGGKSRVTVRCEGA
jgi:sortase A